MRVCVFVMLGILCIRPVTMLARSSYCCVRTRATRSYSPVTEYTSVTPVISSRHCAVSLTSPRCALIRTIALTITQPPFIVVTNNRIFSLLYITNERVNERIGCVDVFAKQTHPHTLFFRLSALQALWRSFAFP